MLKYLTFKYVCSLNEIICNDKQRWNKDKCRCECKELIDKGVCDKGFIWNPSNCECECNKSLILVNIWIIQIVSVRKS